MSVYSCNYSIEEAEVRGSPRIEARQLQSEPRLECDPAWKKQLQQETKTTEFCVLESYMKDKPP